MAIAFVKEVSNLESSTSATSRAIPITNAPAAGNVLTLETTFTNATTISSVTDSKGNTWTVNKLLNPSASDCVAIASTSQNAGALTTSDTVTVSFGTTTVSLFVGVIHEWSGLTTTVDQSSSAQNGTASTSRSAGTTATTTNANDLVLAAFETNVTDSSFTAGTGYTAPTPGFYTLTKSTTHISLEFEYQIVSSTGAFNPTGTGASGASAGVCVCFKGAAGGVANTLTASPGAMTITGDAITPPVARRLASSPGAMSVTGDAALLPTARRLSISPGTVAITGDAAVLSYVRNLVASSGSISIAGDAIVSTLARALSASSGQMDIAGLAATLSFISAVIPLASPYGADQYGFNPFPGRYPNDDFYPGPLTAWKPYQDEVIIVYQHATNLFVGLKDKTGLLALGAAGIGPRS